jgi:hypothetical protein
MDSAIPESTKKICASCCPQPSQADCGRCNLKHARTDFGMASRIVLSAFDLLTLRSQGLGVFQIVLEESCHS